MFKFLFLTSTIFKNGSFELNQNRYFLMNRPLNYIICTALFVALFKVASMHLKICKFVCRSLRSDLACQLIDLSYNQAMATRRRICRIRVLAENLPVWRI